MKTKGRATLPADEQLHDLPEASRRLGGLSHWTLRRWAAAGKLATVKIGARVLVPESEIARLMQQGYRPAAAEREVGR